MVPFVGMEGELSRVSAATITLAVAVNMRRHGADVTAEPTTSDEAKAKARQMSQR